MNTFTEEAAKKYINKFDSLKNDTERWKWVIKNQTRIGFGIHISRDGIEIHFPCVNEELESYTHFNGDNIEPLLEAVDIKYFN